MLPTAPISALMNSVVMGGCQAAVAKGRRNYIRWGARGAIRWHKNRAPGRFRCRRSTTAPRRSTCHALAAFQPGVESIAQAVTEQVDADDRDQDGEAGEGDDPG